MFDGGGCKRAPESYTQTKVDSYTTLAIMTMATPNMCIRLCSSPYIYIWSNLRTAGTGEPPAGTASCSVDEKSKSCQQGRSCCAEGDITYTKAIPGTDGAMIMTAQNQVHIYNTAIEQVL